MENEPERVNPIGTPRKQLEHLTQASRDEITKMSPDDVQKLIQELQVHQIELELQIEELRQAQAALSESRDLYADLYEFAPVGYATVDQDGMIQAANLALARMLGIERGQLTNSPLSKFVARESQETLHHHRQAVFSDEENPQTVSGFSRHTCEVELLPVDGTSLFARVQSERVTDDDQHSKHCRTTISDITPQKIAEQQLVRVNEELEHRVALRTAELSEANSELLTTSRRLQNLLDSVDAVVSEWDVPTMRPTFVSQRVGEILGYPQSRWFETPDLWSTILVHPEDRDAALQFYAEQTEAGRGRELEYRVRHADGHVVWVKEYASVITDEDGAPAKLVCVMIDVTGQKQADLLRYESEQELRAILNTAADAIITIDQQGIMIRVNRAVTDIFGYAADELVGQNIRMLMPQPYHDEHDGYLSRYLQTGEATVIGQSREVTGRRKDGTTFPADLSVSEVDHMGLFTGIVRDTTERHRLQREVLNIVSEEQRRFGQDLHDGLGQELTGAGIMADTLATMLSRKHDEAADQARSLSDLIKQVGTHAREMAHGLMPVDMDSHGLMTALRGLAEQITEVRGVDCSFKCPKPVSIDDNQTAMHLYRIAQEACGNAIRHGLPQRLRIELKTSGRMVILKIDDDGRGIEDQEASLNGNGLGLRIMRYRASLIGGQLTIRRTSADHGTSIACSVPLT